LKKLRYDGPMNLTLTLDREEDGRWIVEIPELSGVMTYGATREEAMAKAEVLALRVLADRIEHDEAKPVPISIVLPAAA
jgi:predicted RNase H-like HicB family nuclease